MLDERDTNTLPPIPEEEISSFQSSFFYDGAYLPENVVRPVFTPSSSLHFDDERDIVPRQISQSPIFIRGFPTLSPIMSTGLFDLKPLLHEDTAEACAAEEPIQEEKALNTALSLEQCIQFDKAEEDLNKKEKEVKDIMAMEFTKNDADLVRKLGLKEEQSPTKIIHIFSREKRMRKSCTIPKFSNSVALCVIMVVGAVIGLQFYLSTMEWGFNSMPVVYDSCPIEGGEFSATQRNLQIEWALFRGRYGHDLSEIEETQENQGCMKEEVLNILGLATEESQMDQNSIKANQEPEKEDLERNKNEDEIDEETTVAKEEGPNFQEENEDKDTFEEHQVGSDEVEEEMQPRKQEMVQNESKRRDGLNCETRVDDFLREKNGKPLVIPKACLSLIKPNQFM